MKSKLTTFVLLFCCLATVKGQGQNPTPSQKAFSVFANRSDSLREIAYRKLDTKTYQTMADEFVKKYDKLSDADKRYFKGNFINAYYNLCCTYALANNKEQALFYLNKSVKVAGMTDYAHLQEDVDLVNIRSETGYKNEIDYLRGIYDYQYILRKAAKYKTEDKRELPVFTYQSANEPHLQALRKAFKLDSIAGTGNDISQMINLLHWIHNLVPHDGQHDNPEIKNAMSMIAVCKRDNRGLNCRGLATVLNECYLSLGFKSRFVTCLPKDSLKIDPDCHVINMVYSYSLKKWVWIDPTNEAYVMSEDGTMLGLAEVRERIIDNKPLIVNPDANWNHRQSTLKQEYLFRYMAKNLYMLQCAVSSEYDTETNEPGKKITYIQLLPLDYFKQSPDKWESTSKEGTTKIFYKTNNPTFFWQAPPVNVTASR